MGSAHQDHWCGGRRACRRGSRAALWRRGQRLCARQVLRAHGDAPHWWVLLCDVTLRLPTTQRKTHCCSVVAAFTSRWWRSPVYFTAGHFSSASSRRSSTILCTSRRTRSKSIPRGSTARENWRRTPTTSCSSLITSSPRSSAMRTICQCTSLLTCFPSLISQSSTLTCYVRPPHGTWPHTRSDAGELPNRDGFRGISSRSLFLRGLEDSIYHFRPSPPAHPHTCRLAN